MTAVSPSQDAEPRVLVASLVFIALVVAAVGSLGAPLITSVAQSLHVSLASAQWTLTITLFAGAIATPLLGRLGAGQHRRGVILGTLAVVVVGSVLTVLPLSFAWLLIGRAGQGIGLGLTALMMGVARDHLPEGRSASTIALVSVASTIGIGVGYPLAGLLTELGGVRAAYGLGLIVAAVAFLAAFRTIPAPPQGRSARVDLPGAVLLSCTLFLVLFLVSEPNVWTRHLAEAVVLGVLAVVLLGVWVVVELRASSPLVDVRLLRNPAVAGANAAMFVGGIGMYLLLTLITRYAQTPQSAGYGFALTTFAAGLVLVPFSVLGFVAGRITPFARERIGAPLILAASSIVVGVAFGVFSLGRANFVELLSAMALLGFGVGGFSAAMPGVILAVTPPRETSSAMSVNQVVRSIGFSLGSAAGGVLLATGTASGRFPTNNEYTTAALAGGVVMAVTVVMCVVLAWQSASSSELRDTDERSADRSGLDYRLESGSPSVEDYLHLRLKAGLSPKTVQQGAAALPGAWCTYRMVHVASNDVVAMGRVIGDGGWYFHIVDMAVLPEHQRRGIGDAILTALVEHIKSNAPSGAYVTLLADNPGRRLYERHGFGNTAPGSIGMAMYIT